MTHEPTDISEQNLDDWEEEARPIEIPSSTTKNARIKLLIAEVRRLRGYVISKEQVTEVITPIVNDFVKEYEIKFRQKDELIAKLGSIAMQVQAYAECGPIIGRMDTSWSVYKEIREVLSSSEDSPATNTHINSTEISSLDNGDHGAGIYTLICKKWKGELKQGTTVCKHGAPTDTPCELCIYISRKDYNDRA